MQEFFLVPTQLVMYLVAFFCFREKNNTIVSYGLRELQSKANRGMIFAH